MWMIVPLAVFVILIAAVAVVIGPFMTLRRLPEGANINGMYLVKDGMVSAGIVPLGDHNAALVDAGNNVEASPQHCCQHRPQCGAGRCWQQC